MLLSCLSFAMQDDVLLAYQLSFDLFENDSQAFNFKVIACHSPMSNMRVFMLGCGSVSPAQLHMHVTTLLSQAPRTHMCWACR